MGLNEILTRGIGLGEATAEHVKKKAVLSMKWESCARELKQMNCFLDIIGGSEKAFKHENTARRMAFAKDLAPCYKNWRSWRDERPVYDRSGQVLRMYYQKDGILDYLLKIENFANMIEPTDDPELLVLKGYNNYIFFLGSFIKKMKTEWETTSGKKAENAGSERNAICNFLTEECQEIGLLGMIPGIRTRMEKYQKKYLPEDIVRTEDYDDIRKLLLECDEWKNSLEGESGKAAKENIALLLKSLEERTLRYSRDIEEGTNLYRVLTELLTPEWMGQFDPDAEGSPLGEMNALEIQAFYQKEMKEIEEKLLKVYMRK
ncbi:MAG: hypothetical protein LUI87_15560 [Lachnospiraceae bacterium]|nr:hypothetical protein [Lachnospiraceae bacterium]